MGNVLSSYENRHAVLYTQSIHVQIEHVGCPTPDIVEFSFPSPIVRQWTSTPGHQYVRAPLLCRKLYIGLRALPKVEVHSLRHVIALLL